MVISISRTKVVLIMTLIAVSLLILSVIGQLVQYLTPIGSFHGITYLFSLGLECNFPTYYSAFLSLMSSSLLFLIMVLEKKNNNPHVVKWAVLTIGFLLISIDEIVQIHERLIGPVAELLDRERLGIFTFAWVIPGMAVVILLFIYFFKFISHLKKKIRFNILLAALLFLGGAIGFELISGRYYELHGAENLTYRMMQNAEESLEMAGLILFIWTLNLFISENYISINFKFTSKKD